MDLDEDISRARGPRHASRVDSEQAVDIERRLAALMVRRICNQHACTGTDCAHENHRRDVDFLLSARTQDPGMLDMLGLPREYPDVTEKDRITWLKWLRQSGPPEAALDDVA